MLPGSVWAPLLGPEAAGTVQGQASSFRCSLPWSTPAPQLAWDPPQGASCDPIGLFSSSSRGHRPEAQEGCPSLHFHGTGEARRSPCPDLARITQWVLGHPPSWELPLLSRPNVRMELREQNTEKDTPVPFRGTHTVPGHRGHSCPGM